MSARYSVVSGAVLGAMLLGGCGSPCTHFTFHQVSPGIFTGCKPRSQEDFAKLKKRGIRTIISLETYNWNIEPERRRAEGNGIRFVNVPIFASPAGPIDASFKEGLLDLNDPALRPVYLHCLYGRDRSAMMIALYRIYYEGWAPDDAWGEMIRCGFRSDWFLWGFQRYYWLHTNTPEWALAKPLLQSHPQLAFGTEGEKALSPPAGRAQVSRSRRSAFFSTASP